MYISLWENSRGHPDNVSFMQFSTKIDGFEQKDSQGFENSYNSYEQYPLEKFFIFTIYQNYAGEFNKFFLDLPKVQGIIKKHHQTILQLFYHYVHNLWQSVGGGGGGEGTPTKFMFWLFSENGSISDRTVNRALIVHTTL